MEDLGLNALDYTLTEKRGGQVSSPRWGPEACLSGVWATVEAASLYSGSSGHERLSGIREEGRLRDPRDTLEAITCQWRFRMREDEAGPNRCVSVNGHALGWF